MKNYYDPTATARAAKLMLEVADKYRGNNNFEYDLVDIVRQSLSDEGRITYNRTVADFKSFDKNSFERNSKRFLDILLNQARLLRAIWERHLKRKTNMNGTPVYR